MKIEVSEWGKVQKQITIVAGLIYIIDCMISFIWKLVIANGSVGCISLGIMLFGLGLRQINLYKENNEKTDLILGVILIITCVIFLNMGILGLQGYVYNIMHT